MNFQTFRPVTKPSYKQRKHNFAEHNYNYVNEPNTTKTKTNAQIFAQSQNVQQPIINSVNFLIINHDPHKNKKETNRFYNNEKTIQINTILKTNLILTHKNIFRQMMMNTIIKIINNFPPTKELALTEMINRIFSNHTHEMNKKDNLELIQHLTILIFNNKMQLTQIRINQLRCIMKPHYIIHLQDKVNQLLEKLEKYEIISPVNKEEQPKCNTFINPVIILAKGESFKIVLDARYFNSLIDESKCN